MLGAWEFQDTKRFPGCTMYPYRNEKRHNLELTPPFRFSQGPLEISAFQFFPFRSSYVPSSFYLFPFSSSLSLLLPLPPTPFYSFFLSSFFSLVSSFYVQPISTLPSPLCFTLLFYLLSSHFNSCVLHHLFSPLSLDFPFAHVWIYFNSKLYPRLPLVLHQWRRAA